MKTITHTVHLLQNVNHGLQTVAVGDILRKLLALEGGPGVACAVLGSKHILTWGVEDMLGRETASGTYTLLGSNCIFAQKSAEFCDHYLRIYIELFTIKDLYS